MNQRRAMCQTQYQLLPVENHPTINLNLNLKNP
jgi:hypothetical protein